MSSTTSEIKYTASRAADSKPLEYVARGGFIGYGIIHLLFAWIAFQVAFRGSGQESDQSGALQTLAGNGAGKVLLALIGIGMIGLAIWQAFEAAIGESGPRTKTAIAERVVSGVRAVLYLWLAFYAFKILSGANVSMAQNQQSKSATVMAHSGGRWLVGFVGLVVIGVGVGIFVYGWKKKFLQHLNTQQ